MFNNQNKMRRLSGFKRFLTPLAVASLAITMSTADAKIDLVTLPTKDKTQLSIYKSEDITLVRETRSLSFNEGENQIQFSWANTLIDPTSLQMRLVEETGDFVIMDSYYPANTQNTIVWNVEAETEGQTQVEITYFASGLNWSANYVAVANEDETQLTLTPRFLIRNDSGEDFENTETRLVVGEINLEEAIAELARRGLISKDDASIVRSRFAKSVAMNERDQNVFADFAGNASPFAGASMEARQEMAQIVKEAVSEYYLYTIEGQEDLETGWGKELPNPTVDEIDIDVSYEYNPNKYGAQVIKFYKFKNDDEHNLGDTPMPSGMYYVYSEDGRNGLRPEGQFNHKYAPVGEDIELNLGSDGEVLLEERVMKVYRDNIEFKGGNGVVSGWDETSEIEIEIRNSKTVSVPFKLTRPFYGDWEITDSSETFKKVDLTTAEWEFNVPAESKKVITLTVVQRNGSRSQTNSK